MASTAAEGARLSRSEVEATARREVTRAVTRMVNDAAGRTLTPLRTTELTWSGVNTVQPEPIAQIEAAHALETVAHAVSEDLIRIARAAGRSWHEIGDALDLHGQAVVAKEPLAKLVTTTRSNTRSARACADSRGPAPPASS